MKVAVENVMKNGESLVTVTVTDEGGRPPQGDHPEWHIAQVIPVGQCAVLDITDEGGNEPDLDDAFIQAAVSDG